MIYILELDCFTALLGQEVVEEYNIVDIVYNFPTIKECAEEIEYSFNTGFISEELEVFLESNGLFIFNNSKYCAIDMNYNYNKAVRKDEPINSALEKSKFKFLSNSGRNLTIYNNLKVFIRNKKIDEIGL